ncbi:MAG: M48 family metallopeptidase [Proteobacteria bacterium]|nr:M48 family metallopeptidase [Pseudomonadota bacterium]
MTKINTAYDNIKSNNRKTAMLVVAFPMIFVVLVFFAIWIAISATSAPDAGNIMPTVLSTTAMVAIPTAIACLVWLLISWAFGDSMMLSAAGANEIHNDQPEYKQVFRSVENVAIAAGLPMPRVYIIDDDSLNAFATGRTPNDASIALTRGIIAKLNRLELEGVIAHEMAHIGNRDIRLDMLLITGVGVTVFTADIVARMLFFGGGRDNDRDGKQAAAILLAVWIAFMIFNWIFVPILRMAISRKREFAADATGAFITRNPRALADALRKISVDPRVEVLDNRKTMAAVCIADPRAKAALGEFVGGLYATHPPVAERIKRLENM